MEHCLIESYHKKLTGQGTLELVNEIFLGILRILNWNDIMLNCDVPGLEDKGRLQLCPFLMIKEIKVI